MQMSQALKNHSVAATPCQWWRCNFVVNSFLWRKVASPMPQVLISEFFLFLDSLLYVINLPSYLSIARTGKRRIHTFSKSISIKGKCLNLSCQVQFLRR